MKDKVPSSYLGFVELPSTIVSLDMEETNPDIVSSSKLKEASKLLTRSGSEPLLHVLKGRVFSLQR